MQQTLDSNYELFGLVVTDCKIKERYCPQQKIQYLSKSEEKPRPWRKYLKVNEVQNYSHNLLQNPPPLYAEWQYDNPHSKDNERQVNKKLNKGEIIGRVYYVRGVPPTYLEDITKFIQNPFKDSGGSRIYLLTVALCWLAGLSCWIVIELILYRKNTLEKELASENTKILTLKANKLLEAENESTKQKNDLLEAEKQLEKQRNNLLEAENKIARTRGFIGGIQEVIEQDFSSVISNRLQELKGIFSRLNTDIDNIAHDMRKAPLIRAAKNASGITVERLSHLPLNESEKDRILQDIIKYLKDGDQTIMFINWVIDDLNQIANLESKPICVQQEIENFSKKLPPNLEKKWLTINFHDRCEKPLWINCNPWHLRSIVKNVLYNSTAALMRFYEEHDYNFQCKISVTCVLVGNEAGILVEDNGPGFNEETLKKLYQVPNTVDENAEANRGRGSIIVFSYLSLHGGRVELANIPERGAKAMFLFPLTSPF